jgi:hypothetical protein
LLWLVVVLVQPSVLVVLQVLRVERVVLALVEGLTLLSQQQLPLRLVERVMQVRLVVILQAITQEQHQ